MDTILCPKCSRYIDTVDCRVIRVTKEVLEVDLSESPRFWDITDAEEETTAEVYSCPKCKAEMDYTELFASLESAREGKFLRPSSYGIEWETKKE